MSEYDVCRRQILTHEECPHTEKIKTCIMAIDPYLKKEPTKTFMRISNGKKPFDLHGLGKSISVL